MFSNFGFNSRHLGCLAASTGGIQNTAESLSVGSSYKNAVITMPTVLCPRYWRDSKTIEGTAESLSPEYWQFQDAFATTPTMLCAKYWRESQTIEGTADPTTGSFRMQRNPEKKL